MIIRDWFFGSSVVFLPFVRITQTAHVAFCADPISSSQQLHREIQGGYSRLFGRTLNDRAVQYVVQNLSGPENLGKSLWSTGKEEELALGSWFHSVRYYGAPVISPIVGRGWRSN